MIHKFPLSEYRLSNGGVFRPSEFPVADLSLRAVLPDYEVSQNEIVKILYNHQGTPITLSGYWDAKVQDWLFEGQIGLSKEGEASKPLVELFSKPFEPINGE